MIAYKIKVSLDNLKGIGSNGDVLVAKIKAGEAAVLGLVVVMRYTIG